jgi:hypothetical protein
MFTFVQHVFALKVWMWYILWILKLVWRQATYEIMSRISFHVIATCLTKRLQEVLSMLSFCSRRFLIVCYLVSSFRMREATLLSKNDEVFSFTNVLKGNCCITHKGKGGHRNDEEPHIANEEQQTAKLIFHCFTCLILTLHLHLMLISCVF